MRKFLVQCGPRIEELAEAETHRDAANKVFADVDFDDRPALGAAIVVTEAISEPIYIPTDSVLRPLGMELQTVDQ